MTSIMGIERWDDEHQVLLIDLLRICFGLFLVVKGAFLAEHGHEILNVLNNSNFELLPIVGFQYMIFAQTVGGFLLAIGLLTRTMALLILPIPVFMVFFITLPHVFSPLNTELVLSIITLLLTLLFLYIGAGPLSSDHYLSTHVDH